MPLAELFEKNDRMKEESLALYAAAPAVAPDNSIERLSEISSTIAAAVEEQGAATQEISRNVQQAAQGTKGDDF